MSKRITTKRDGLTGLEVHELTDSRGTHRWYAEWVFDQLRAKKANRPPVKYERDPARFEEVLANEEWYKMVEAIEHGSSEAIIDSENRLTLYRASGYWYAPVNQ